MFSGGFFSGSTPARRVRAQILRLCSALKPEAVALVDVIAPPDFILNSPIGHSDGQVVLILLGAPVLRFKLKVN